MFCSQCGIKTPVAAKFCHVCGAPLVVEPADRKSTGDGFPTSEQEAKITEQPPAVVVASGTSTWRCSHCRQLNRPGTLVCACGQPYQPILAANSAGSVPDPSGPSVQRVANPSFRGRGSDIFSVAGLKMLLWYVSIVGMPVGWMYTARWAIKNINLPGGPQLNFTGATRNAYGYFGLMFVFAAINQLDPTKWELFSGANPLLVGLGTVAVGFGLLIAQCLLYWHLYKWVCANVVATNGSRLEFVGRPWPYVGWILLQILSIFTIVGWAWVQTAFLRWQLKRTCTSRICLGFNGSGFGLLWRTVGVSAASVFLLPLPWMVAYMYGWLVRNIEIRTVEREVGA